MVEEDVLGVGWKATIRGDGSDGLDLSLEGFDFIRTGSAAGKVRRTLCLSDFFEVRK